MLLGGVSGAGLAGGAQGGLVMCEATYKGCPVQVLGMGINGSGYHGAFTPQVERVIESLIVSPALHLFSGRSMLGDERIDLERPEATQRRDVMGFLQEDRREWAWMLLDPPYEQERKSKLDDYAKPMSLAADVELRRTMYEYAGKHCENVLWLDYSLPLIPGFERAGIWIFVAGGLSPTRNLSWLRRTTRLLL